MTDRSQRQQLSLWEIFVAAAIGAGLAGGGSAVALDSIPLGIAVGVVLTVGIALLIHRWKGTR